MFNRRQVLESLVSAPVGLAGGALLAKVEREMPAQTPLPGDGTPNPERTDDSKQKERLEAFTRLRCAAEMRVMKQCRFRIGELLQSHAIEGDYCASLYDPQTLLEELREADLEYIRAESELSRIL